MKKVLIYLSLLLLGVSSFVYADINGVWHNAEDIRGGIFGADEQSFVTNYTFINPVFFKKDVLMKDFIADHGNIGILYVNGKVGINNSNPQVALDVNGEIRINRKVLDTDENRTVVNKEYLDKKVSEIMSYII